MDSTFEDSNVRKEYWKNKKENKNEQFKQPGEIP
jgi:hypothetical protein